MVWRISRRACILATGLFTLANAATQSGVPNLEPLVHVKLFAFGGIGFAGVISLGEKEYDDAMSRSSRQEILEKAFDRGTPEAKSYALVGLFNLNRARFDVLASAVRSSTLEVHTAKGCIFGKTTLGAITGVIGAGEYSHFPMKR